MAYGRRASNSRRGYAGALRKRRTNTPVRKALRAPPKRARTVSGRNRRAVTTLARQVTHLQQRVRGQVQYLYQTANMSSQLATDVPREFAPLGFDATSFYDASNIYQGTIVPGGLPGSGGTPILHTVKSWRNKAYLPLVQLEPQFQWAPRASTDATVSYISYYPISMSYKFNWKGTLTNDAIPTFRFPLRYRVTFFKMKNYNQPTNAVMNIAMPSQLGAYCTLCADNPANRINFSKMYHEVLMDKWISFDNDPEQTHSQKNVNKTLSFDYVFPKDTEFKPNLKVTEPTSTLWTNIPVSQTIWCVISSNQVNGTTISPLVLSMSRFVKWRDNHGVTT